MTGRILHPRASGVTVFWTLGLLLLGSVVHVVATLAHHMKAEFEAPRTAAQVAG